MTSPVAGPSFSSATAAVYIFNLIVGTGALALPRAFQEAGSVQCTAVQSRYFTMLAMSVCLCVCVCVCVCVQPGHPRNSRRGMETSSQIGSSLSLKITQPL